ncbi:MAG TPA: DoxX family protein [Terriglobales bacterium]|nr:DoxX family protein [Terriglobales bacterium]
MSPWARSAAKLYALYVRLANYLQSPLLLAVRLYWGWQFAQDGWGKLGHIPRVTDYFASIGVPQPHITAYAIALLELAGGILFIFGLGSRLIALPLTINMMMAYVFGDREALHSIFSDPGKFYAADPYTFLFASLLILVFGPGKFALDTLIGHIAGGRMEAASRETT